MGADVSDDRVPEPDLSEAGAGLRIAVVCGRFNSHVTLRLLEGVRRGLAACGVHDVDVREDWVAGAFEIPLAAKTFAATGAWDAVVAIGCVIRGDTAHFDYVAGGASSGISSVALETGVPTIFGVITTETIEQAIERAGTKMGNKGFEAAVSAIEMADLLPRIKQGATDAVTGGNR